VGVKEGLKKEENNIFDTNLSYGGEFALRRNVGPLMLPFFFL
jgi:hypothetical protein